MRRRRTCPADLYSDSYACWQGLRSTIQACKGSAQEHDNKALAAGQTRLLPRGAASSLLREVPSSGAQHASLVTSSVTVPGHQRTGTRVGETIPWTCSTDPACAAGSACTGGLATYMRATTVVGVSQSRGVLAA